VVIKAVLGRRAKGDLRPWIEVLHRLGEDMRIIVPHEFERFGLVARGDQREARIALKRPHDVADLAVDLRSKRGLGEPRPDHRCDIRRGRALRHLLYRAVGKRDLEHDASHVARRDKPLNRLRLGYLANSTVPLQLHGRSANWGSLHMDALTSAPAAADG